jgi:hypothetical protein
MRISTFGAIVAGTVMSLAGSLALAESHATDAKACYRKSCGSSVKGHEGKCSGTKVAALTTQAACEAAGGAWVTAAEAKTFEDTHD